MWEPGQVRRRSGGGRPGALRPGFLLMRGMRVGLYGGSFNPAHEGHAHVAETALRRLGLHRVIWLVSPQNPLKSRDQTRPLEQRLARVRALARGPGMIASDIEARLDTRFTLDTLLALKTRFPGVRFVWIMGADGLAGFHHWRGWRQIMRALPVAVVARPPISPKSRFSPAARRFSSARLSTQRAPGLHDQKPPAWIFLHGPLHFQSSTALRETAAAESPRHG